MKALVFLALIPLLLLAADVSGKWKAQVGGGAETIFTLKLDGAKIGGSMTNGEGKRSPIIKGELKGDAISFTVASEWQGNPVILIANGAVRGNEIDLTITNDGGQWIADLILKRVQ